ncbi:MAG TPA: HEPN-associated N-terminal domain-containing protein [Gemmatimonadaceae bacterium]|nr:HEPN-associated N-terminal domain-containing protein [Gemmatimonadaceae bacterium]
MYDEGATVCGVCLSEPDYLSNLIAANATATECSYCGRVTEEPSAMLMEDLIDVISGAVSEEYEDAADSVPYESAEGGYQMTTYTSDELLYGMGLFSRSRELMRDIADALPDYAWVERDPFGLSRYDALQFGWEEFCRQIKHVTRFMFFRRRRRTIQSHDDIRPYEMLSELGSLIKELGLVTVLPLGTILFRVRQHVGTVHPQTLSELGPPPTENAVHANRLTPAGISMLYAALDPVTAAKETLNRRSKRLRWATTAEIETLRDLSVIDLTALPPIPNIFDREFTRDQRQAIAFIHSFTEDLTKPVRKDGREHIEYVPSQVVTEYIRYRFLDADRERANGIVYPSAKDPIGRNVVLFYDSDDCSPIDLLGTARGAPLRLRTSRERGVTGHP